MGVVWVLSGNTQRRVRSRHFSIWEEIILYRLFIVAVMLVGLVCPVVAQTAADADFNGNGIVDIPDFLLFADHFGSSRGDGTYDAKYDLDNNGVVGIPDFFIFVDFFGQSVPESEEITIKMELPYPEDANNIRVGIPEVSVTCTVGCEGQQTKVTDGQGHVTFIGNTPLTIRAEKSGHIPVEQQTYGGRVNMGHEWPIELREAIRQLNLADAIATGELFLIWGDKEYIDADGWGLFACPVIIIKQIQDRNFMLAILAHEAMHAWQGRRSANPPCDLHYGYPSSEDGRAWTEAWEKDIRDHGPYPGVDGEDWASTVLENQASIYGHWYWGPETEWLVEPEAWADKKAALEKLYRIAPNRCRYLEDRFGSPPPR